MEHRPLTMSKPWTLCFAIAGLLGTLPSQAQSVQTLDLTSYLEATLHYHLAQREHEAVARAELLSLRDGQRRYWPDITARTAYDEVISETSTVLTAPATRTIENGVTTGLDSSWTSWVGTEVSLGLEHQYGRQSGKASQAIPEEGLQAHNLNVEISQPLLKHNTPGYNSMQQFRARSAWQQYQTEGELGRLSLLRDAMLDFTVVQEAYDRLRIEQEKLELSRFLAEVTQAQVNEGRSLSIDRDLSQLDVLRQEQSVAEAQFTVQQSQHSLSLSWVHHANIQVEPLPSTAALLDRLLSVLRGQSGHSEHPEYRQQQLQLGIAKLEERAGRRDHWPDLSVFYRYEKNYRDVLPDEESQAWGLHFSYALFDVPTREQQARRRAQTTIARWNAEDRLKQLQWDSTQLVQGAETRLNELDLHARSLTLSQRALDQEFERYREGLASYTDVQNRQQDLLDRQLAELTTQVELARGLIELAYYRQWDWLSRLQ
jgi:outer membrane protein TolC